MKKYKSLRGLEILVISLLSLYNSCLGQTWNPSHKVGTINGIYSYSYNQTPAQLVEIFPAAIPNTGLTYQWEQSSSPIMATTTIVGTSSGYSFSGPLTQTSYYRRKTKISNFNFVYSNIIKISVVSVNWEDHNYIREHEVRTTGITNWQAVDQLTIGPKLQSTTYLDGIGRPIEKIAREAATPASGTLWGDIVQFSIYEPPFGRENKKYLPYSTTTESGKFKTAPLTEQTQYYTTNYNESYAYTTIYFEAAPLNRVTSINQPGYSWRPGVANGLGSSYEVNTTTDNVKIFDVDYVQGNVPVINGTYPAGKLHKRITIDENGKKIVEFTDKEGRLILKKVQLDDNPAGVYSGWVCTYSVYDDFGQLRFQIQPEGVKYLDNNGWSFAGANGQTILNEQCFQYNYDDKGRVTWKKAPGAEPLSMIYDERDRLVFAQDGNQAALPIPQWTTTLYDELDRVIITTLYNTTKTRTSLQTDLTNAATTASLTITNPSGSVSVTTYKNPVSTTDINNSSVNTILKYVFYDDYSFNGVKSFNTNYTNTSAYNPIDPDVIPITTSNRTISFATGSKTRILGSDEFLSSTTYYDNRGQLIQTLEDNVKSGVDIVTLQHHFDGRVLSTCTDHTTPGTGYTNFKVLTKYIFDKLGRGTSVQKQFGSNAMKTVTSYDYDDIGRIKTKHLDPGYTGGGNAELESLVYSYNIHNQITGINKDYALKSPGNYNKWGHFFGFYLGYDNRDGVFSASNLNGQVTGSLWNTQGDDAQRRYNFSYDNAGRLVNAVFTEQKHVGDGWSNSQMDFSVSGYTNGKISYDLNGNFINMLHKGVIPGTASPITVDNLNYTYSNYSNKLQSVSDQMTNSSVNGKFGDFKDGSNGVNPDYVYDANGNLVIDLNKDVQSVNGGAPGTNGIKYNFLDKPELIRIVGKGTVRIVYDADGEKLQRAFIPEAGGASTITTYINSYTYQETATITTSTPTPLGGTPTLSFINFEEGRIRVISPVPLVTGLDELAVDGNMDLPNSQRGVYDYFLSDYQGNVRMILTEETHHAANTATMETNRSTLEESIFGQTGSGNEVLTTRVNTPAAWQNAAVGSSVSRLGTNFGHNIGPNTLQKVMAGDKVSAKVDYYYPSSVTGNNSSFVSQVLGSLAQAIGGNNSNNLVKENASAITTQLNGVNDFVTAVQPNGSNPPGTTPQAYCTILFFDERFNFISASDGGVAQEQVASSVGSAGLTLGLTNLQNVKAPKNGYVYVYVSNQSNEAVYFDGLRVTIDAANIIEENHYYAYGLKIAAISSKKVGDNNEGVLKNNYLYNGKELFEDGDLNWYDYGFRNYDPQIGRFTQLDPLTDDYPFYTPYQFAGCEPIANIDIDGLEPAPANVVSFATRMQAEGASNVTINLINSGRYAGQFSVSGYLNGQAFSHFFKVATMPVGQPLISATLSAALPGLNATTKIDRPNQYKPSADQTYQQGRALELQRREVESAPAMPSGPVFAPSNAPFPSKPSPKVDPYINILKQEAKEKLNKANDGFPIVGPLVKSFRMGMNGYGKEAISSLGDAAVDIATSYGPQAVAKYAFAVKNKQLVQRAATLAERAIGGVGKDAGRLKHTYATALLKRYQGIYGDRGLRFQVYFNNGPKNRGFLDVLDEPSGMIYDWKFGYPNMTPAELNQTGQMLMYRRNLGLPSTIIKP